MIEIRIDFHQSGQRLDRLLRKEFKSLPLSRIFSLFRKKKIRINGVRAKGEEILSEGDLISIYENLEVETDLNETEVEIGWGGNSKKSFEVVYEDDHFLICNKPAGLAVQPGSGVAQGESLIEEVWAYLGHKRAQLAHRLDKATSGVIAIGKDGPSIRDLTSWIRSRQAVKIYHALVVGKLEGQGKIDVSLERQDAAKGSKMQVSSKGQQALTYYKVIQSFDTHTLVEVELATGRMHQIRAHMAHIGHPLIGDDRYGDFEKNKWAKKELRIKRLCLHAAELGLPNLPRFKAETPKEFFQ